MRPEDRHAAIRELSKKLPVTSNPNAERFASNYCGATVKPKKNYCEPDLTGQHYCPVCFG